MNDQSKKLDVFLRTYAYEHFIKNFIFDYLKSIFPQITVTCKRMQNCFCQNINFLLVTFLQKVMSQLIQQCAKLPRVTKVFNLHAL